jgi:tetratricopeptide (TPR) repeat protein
VALCVLVTVGFAPLWAASDSKEAREEMRFGYKVAREGYWQEALMRFRQAAELQPGDPEILNNIAVALEATGDYEAAREAYGHALTLAPGNPVLRGNFQAFEQFYKENIADLEAPEELPAAVDTDDAAETEGASGDGAGGDGASAGEGGDALRQ